MKFVSMLVGLGLLLVTNNAFALMMGFTEGVRDQVAGTTVIVPTDATNTAPGFDVGSLTSVGDSISIYGRIVNAADFYTFTSATAFNIDFIFGGLALENGGSTTTSGFVFDTQGDDSDNTSDFSLQLGMNAAIVAQFVTEVTGGNSLIFSGGPGTYTFSIDGAGGGALYDIKISAVPIPAALPLLLGGIGLLALFGRREKV